MKINDQKTTTDTYSISQDAGKDSGKRHATVKFKDGRFDSCTYALAH